MNRPLLLTAAVVLTAAAASPTAQAQAPKKPVPVPASLDCLQSVRAHAAMMRAQPLPLPLTVLRWPQAVPTTSLSGMSSSMDAVHQPTSSSLYSR